MGEIRRVAVNKSSIFTVKLSGKTYYNCRIETLDGKKYGIINDKGKLVLIVKLSSKEIKEFYRYGSIDNGKMSIIPMNRRKEHD